jgi:hypothetical protein
MVLLLVTFFLASPACCICSGAADNASKHVINGEAGLGLPYFVCTAVCHLIRGATSPFSIMMAWIRRTAAGSFVLLGARLAFPNRQDDVGVSYSAIEGR